MNRRDRDRITASQEPVYRRSHETEPCTSCSTPLHFATDGMGRIIPQCPHCDWGWPAPRARPVMPTCEHGVGVDEVCRKCVEKRHAIRDGLKAYYQSKTHQRATYDAQRAEANPKGWATRRRKSA